MSVVGSANGKRDISCDFGCGCVCLSGVGRRTLHLQARKHAGVVPEAPQSKQQVRMSQGAICDGPGSEGSAMACFAYPKERFKDKPLFVAATFFVSEIRSAKTEKECLKGSPNWLVINSKAGTTTINHVAFKTFEIGDNWTSGGQDGPAYRTFHNGMCYELGIQTFTSRAEYDPGTVKQFTKKDWSEVEDRLRQALNSFVFLK
jgi:hypothetical protein